MVEVKKKKKINNSKLTWIRQQINIQADNIYVL